MKLLLLSILLLLATQSVMAWGKRGHDVIAYIAECHLRDDASVKIDKIMGGRSMVYYSNWMDSASHSKEYAETREWHYYDVESKQRSKKGDVLNAIESIVTELTLGDLTLEQEHDALKMLIHLVGDMHQPMHLGRDRDEGGNNIPVVYFVESTSLHALWDYHLVEGAHLWSYTEWQEQIDRGLIDEKIITAGSYMDWIEATHEITKEIYRDTPAETRIFYDYMDKYTPIIEQQFLYAGVRLAHILNGIYSDLK